MNDSTSHRKIRMNPNLISAFPQSIHTTTKKKKEKHEKARLSEYYTVLDSAIQTEIDINFKSEVANNNWNQPYITISEHLMFISEHLYSKNTVSVLD